MKSIRWRLSDFTGPPFFHRAANNSGTMVSTLDGLPENVRLPSEDEPEEERVFNFTLHLDNGY